MNKFVIYSNNCLCELFVFCPISNNQNKLSIIVISTTNTHFKLQCTLNDTSMSCKFLRQQRLTKSKLPDPYSFTINKEGFVYCKAKTVWLYIQFIHEIIGTAPRVNHKS